MLIGAFTQLIELALAFNPPRAMSVGLVGIGVSVGIRIHSARAGARQVQALSASNGSGREGCGGM